MFAGRSGQISSRSRKGGEDEGGRYEEMQGVRRLVQKTSSS
jgi:hypothetical protein